MSVSCHQETPQSQESYHRYRKNALTAIYNILKKDEPYNTDLYRQADKPPVHRTVTADESVYILQHQGYIVTPTTT